MIRDRMKSITGGVNFWPHRSLLQNEKWMVQLLLNKYFVLVFTAYFLLVFCFCFVLFFSSNLKLLFPLILEYVALLDVERTLIMNRSEFIHIKWPFHSSKHDFFFNFDQRPKSTKAIRIKVLHEEWKRYFFLPINETLTINSPLPHFRLTSLNRRGPENEKRVFKSNPKLIPAQSNTRFEIRLMPRLPWHITCA